MIIDCHTHLLPRRVREDRSSHCFMDRAFGDLYSSATSKLASESDIIDYMDREGIDRAIVFGFPWENRDLIKTNNDEIWDFHAKWPDRIEPFAILSAPFDDKMVAEADYRLSGGFAGIGELAVYREGWTERDLKSVSPIARLAAAAAVPVVIHVNEPVGHAYPGKVQIDFPALFGLIKDHPDVDFILAHLGGGAFVYGLMPEVAEILRSTYWDMAAVPYLYHPRVYEAAAQCVGQEKILFGSDFPLLPLGRTLKDLDRAGIGEDFRRAILGENVMKVLEKKRRRDGRSV